MNIEYYMYNQIYNLKVDRLLPHNYDGVRVTFNIFLNYYRRHYILYLLVALIL